MWSLIKKRLARAYNTKFPKLTLGSLYLYSKEKLLFVIRKICLFLLLLCCNHSFSQKEANNWYFGRNAGLQFNTSPPTTLTDGLLSTSAGCSVISDANGNLLFYTDGGTVRNRNHEYMPSTFPNVGTLNGCTNTTQAAIIIPKPGDPNLYFIFTLDCKARPDGLQYSIVDMTLEGGLGDVSTINVPLNTPMTEKLTAVRSTSFNGYWVISHEWGNNHFVAYRVTSSGVDPSPVISASGDVVNGSVTNTEGQMKVSPDGKRIGMASGGEMNTVQIFDFDAATGLVSSPRTIVDEDSDTNTYGIEFSPSGDILYVSGLDNGVYQYDLTSGSLSDIISSEFKMSVPTWPFASLQLAIDGKIYVVRDGMTTMDYIDDPEVMNDPFNYVANQIDLGGKRGTKGLPPFIQSFFSVGFSYEQTCENAPTEFTSNISDSYDTISWDFGDGALSSEENPSHTYNSSGIYTVTLTVTSGSETSQEIKDIIIYDQPVANMPQNISICDNDNDGFASFDLTTQNTSVLGTQDPSTFDVSYYASMEDYTNDNPITTPENFTNLVAFAPQTIIASVQNLSNGDCESSIAFNIQVFETPTPSQNVPTLSFCDNVSVGTDVDGRIIFNLTQNSTSILNGQSTSNFTLNYFTDVGLTNQIVDPLSYQNTLPNETIFVQVVNNLNSQCSAQTSFEIEVLNLPVVSPVVEIKQCDDDLDGFSFFNLQEVNGELSNNYQNETITFYETESDAENRTNQIVNITSYQNETVSTDSVWARIENSNNCHRTARVNLTISTTQIPSSLLREFYQCDDGTITNDGIASFDFTSVNAEIESLFPAGQQLIISYYRNQADALSEVNAINDISNYQNIGYPNIQDIYVRVDSELDNDCLGLGHHITLHVETVPIANSIVIPEQCDGDRDGLFSFDTSSVESSIINGQTNVSVSYIDQGGNLLPSPLPNPFLTGSQTITARVVNMNSQDPDGACFAETTFEFTVIAVPIANSVTELEECDDDIDGIMAFDTSSVENILLGSQTGMVVEYFDQQGSALPSPLPNPFTTGSQTITARVSNPQFSVCYDETLIDFTVREKPNFELQETGVICITESPQLEVFVENPNGSYTYEWTNESGTILGSQASVMISQLR